MGNTAPQECGKSVPVPPRMHQDPKAAVIKCKNIQKCRP